MRKSFYSKADDLQPFERIALIRKAQAERNAQVTFHEAKPDRAAHYTFSFNSQVKSSEKFDRYPDAWNGLLHQIGYIEIGKLVGDVQRYGRYHHAYGGQYINGFEIREDDGKLMVFGILERFSEASDSWELKSRYVARRGDDMPILFDDMSAAETYITQFIADYCGAAAENIEAAVEAATEDAYEADSMAI